MIFLIFWDVPFGIVLLPPVYIHSPLERHSADAVFEEGLSEPREREVDDLMGEVI